MVFGPSCRPPSQVPVDHRSEAKREPEAEVLLEVRAKVVEVEVVKDLEGLSPGQNVLGDLLSLHRQERGHSLDHFRLMRLNVQLQVRGQSGLEVRPDPVLDVVVELALVHVEHQRVRMEGIGELVDKNGQTTDFLAEGLADLVLNVLGYLKFARRRVCSLIRILA